MQVFSFSFTFYILHYLLAIKKAAVQHSTATTSRHGGKKEVLTPALTTQNQTEMERNFDVYHPVALSVLTGSTCTQSNTAFIGKQKQLHEM
jgi:hypothetical protein